MSIINAIALSGFARKTVNSTSDFATVVHNLIKDVRDSYRPELHYMRGPGPKWCAKHQPWLNSVLKSHRRPGNPNCRRCTFAVTPRGLNEVSADLATRQRMLKNSGDFASRCPSDDGPTCRGSA